MRSRGGSTRGCTAGGLLAIPLGESLAGQLPLSRWRRVARPGSTAQQSQWIECGGRLRRSLRHTSSCVRFGRRREWLSSRRRASRKHGEHRQRFATGSSRFRHLERCFRPIVDRSMHRRAKGSEEWLQPVFFSRHFHLDGASSGVSDMGNRKNGYSTPSRFACPRARILTSAR